MSSLKKKTRRSRVSEYGPEAWRTRTKGTRKQKGKKFPITPRKRRQVKVAKKIAPVKIAKTVLPRKVMMQRSVAIASTYYNPKEMQDYSKFLQTKTDVDVERHYKYWARKGKKKPLPPPKVTPTPPTPKPTPVPKTPSDGQRTLAPEPTKKPPIKEKADFKHPMKPKEATPPSQAPSKVTLANYHQIAIPQKGPIGKKHAPLIPWNKIEKRYAPPAKGTTPYMEYPIDDAPKGVTHELREAFRRNREYVTRGKDPVNVMLHGPAGTGKTIAVKKFAEDTQLPYYYVPAEPGAMTSEQLLGRKEIETTPEGSKTVWHDGTIVKAARTGGILHIDEFSLLDPEVTPRLHELFDSKRRISLEGLSGEVVKAHPDLFVVVSLNPAELGIEGVKPLSQPIRRRFRGIYMDYPPTNVEMKMVKKQVGFTDTEFKVTPTGYATGKYAKEMTGFIRTLHDVRGKADELSYVPTASEAVDFGRELKAGSSTKQAVHRALVGKYVGEDRVKIKESVKAHLTYN